MGKTDNAASLTGKRIELVSFQAKNRQGEPVVNKDGSPRMIKVFKINLPILGKQHEFRIYAKTEEEKNLALDMFGIKKTDSLPAKFEEVVIKNPETGEVTKLLKCYLCFDEKDDIHRIEMKVLDDQKSQWKMAIAEAATNYQSSDDVTAYRHERYEAAKANKKN